MRKTICYIVLLLIALPAFSLTKDSAEPAFTKAGQLYKKGEYRQAAQQYQQIDDLGLHSFELYYNMGNAYFKSNQIASALLYYNKAYKINPNDEDLDHNIKFARKHTIDKIEVPPTFFLYDWWRDAFLLFSLHTWAILLIVSLLIASLAFILYLFANPIKLKKTGFYFGSAFVIVSLFCVILGAAEYNYFNHTKYGIIFDLNVTVKSAPENGNKLFELHQGTKVKILESTDDAINIVLPNGKKGWIAKDAVRKI